MKELAALEAVCGEIDANFERDRATVGDDRAALRRVENKQRLNDQAYFLLCWGQMETAVNEACRDAIRRRRDNPDWRVRRAWDLYHPDDKRLSGLSFEERASLTLDRKKDEHKRLIQYYILRNQIAHGTSRSERIEVAEVIGDFYQIQTSLSR